MKVVIRFSFRIGILLIPISFCVFGCSKKGPSAPENHTPEIVSMVITPGWVAPGDSAVISVIASDPDTDSLQYTYNAPCGVIHPNGTTATWISPSTVVGYCMISVVVSDGELSVQSQKGISVCSPTKVLVDASKDGGVWWAPQNGPVFYPSQNHQGKALADYIRSRGFLVDELPQQVTITDSLLGMYSKVIRATGYWSYNQSELQAYDNFLTRGTSLLLISEFQVGTPSDGLANHLGIPFTSTVYGYVERYAEHEITQGATPFYYNAGSVIMDTTSNPNLEFLGWLGNNPYPVMGILNHPSSKIFFLGDLNGIEGVPQPLVSNLVGWAFE